MTAYATAASPLGTADAQGYYDLEDALNWDGNGVPPLTSGAPMASGDTVTINLKGYFGTAGTKYLGSDPVASPGTTYRILLGANGFLKVKNDAVLRLRDSVRVTRQTAGMRNEKIVVTDTAQLLVDPASGVVLTIDPSASLCGLTAVVRGTSFSEPAVFAVDRSRGGTGGFNTNTTASTNGAGGYIDAENFRIYGWSKITTSVLTSETTLAGNSGHGDTRVGPAIRLLDGCVGKDEANADQAYQWTLQLVTTRAGVVLEMRRMWQGNADHTANVGLFDAGTNVTAVAPSGDGIRVIDDCWFKDVQKLHYFCYGDVTGQTVFSTGINLANTQPLGSIAETVVVRNVDGSQDAIPSVPSGGHWAGLVLWDNPTVHVGDKHVGNIRSTNAAGVTTDEVWTKRLAAWATEGSGGHNGWITSSVDATGHRNVWIEHFLTVPFTATVDGVRAFQPVSHVDAAMHVGFRRCTFTGAGDNTSSGVVATNGYALGVEDCIVLDTRDDATAAADSGRASLLTVRYGTSGTAAVPDATRYRNNIKLGLIAGNIDPVSGTTGYKADNSTVATDIQALGIGTDELELTYDQIATIGFADFGATPATFYTDLSGGTRPTSVAENQTAIAGWMDELEKYWLDPSAYDAAYSTEAQMDYLWAAYTPSYAVAGTMGATPGGSGVTNDGLQYVGAVEPTAAEEGGADSGIDYAACHPMIAFGWAA